MIRRPTDPTQVEPEDLNGDLTAIPSLIASIVETMRQGNVAELEVVRGEFRLSLRTFPSTNVHDQLVVGGVEVRGGEGIDDRDESQDSYVVTAPMIGTFYVASAPGEPPFVSEGDEIDAGQTVCIIEAMKIMNEIATERSGTVLEILVEDGQTVEYGSPLIRIQIAA